MHALSQRMTTRMIETDLYIEKMQIQDILYKCSSAHGGQETPLFVYSSSILHANITSYLNALHTLRCSHQLNYSIKANPNLHLLREMVARGLSATLVSGHELQLALEAGFEPQRLVYNGGGKMAWETRLAVEHDVLLNVDSLWDLHQTISVCRNGDSRPRTCRALLRLNLDIDPQVHKYINTGHTDCKFGLSDHEMEDCLLVLARPSCPVELVGLHCHLGSTIDDVSVYRSSLERLLAVRSQLTKRGFTNIDIINIGGGLGIDYKRREAESRAWRNEVDDNKEQILHVKESIGNIKSGDKYCSSCVEQLRTSIERYISEKISFQDLKYTLYKQRNQQCCKVSDLASTAPSLCEQRPPHSSPGDLVISISDLLPAHVTLILEPGRSLVADAGVLVAKVLGCKRSPGKNFMVVDAAMTEVIRPSLYGAYHHVTLIPGPVLRPCDISSHDNNGEGIVTREGVHANIFEDVMTREVHQEATPRWDKMVYDVVGPVCESGDFIAKDRIFSDPTNCYIIVHDVGAYCSSMASNYNVRMRPAEVLVEGAACRLIRSPDNLQHFLAPYRNLSKCKTENNL